ncbi:MAG: trehalose synthase [Clostridiales Family XIII bacterium]|jgi:maltose alpha-D-glucosyltransferase/alpha-amylase|nr:trehalose synthase [Clostridiales Family XIII bacterium]
MAKWYENAVFYELYTRRFRDADGDGFGDFAGVYEKLDYLKDLGIDAIWFPPFFASPLRDGGYDIANYRLVDPRYGTMESVERVFARAHELGMHIMIDLVINHTSDKHLWFESSRRNPDGPYGDYYVWADDDKGHAGTRVIFSATEPSNWTYDPVRGQYYWHRFYKEQPDLNFDSPAVHREVFEIVDFWAEKGVDGFRLDAIPFLYEREGTNNESLPETHAFLAKLRAYLDEKYGGEVCLLAEATTPADENLRYFGTDDAPECNLCFNFLLMTDLFRAPRLGDAAEIRQTCRKLFFGLPKGAAWSNFFRNHDFLTLELLKESQVREMLAWYAPPQGMLNGGIARRLGPVLEYDERVIRALTALLISLPGAPCWYYGDEILMGDDPSLPDRDSVRLSMPWDAVERAQADPNSFLNWLRKALRTRRMCPPLLEGGFEILEGGPPQVFAFRRKAPDGQSVTFSIDFATMEYEWR